MIKTNKERSGNIRVRKEDENYKGSEMQNILDFKAMQSTKFIYLKHKFLKDTGIFSHTYRLLLWP